jgi:SAM-dependent methyltransferase
VKFESFGQRFSRFATNVVMRSPRLWFLVRGPLRRLLDRLAPQWDQMRSESGYAPYEAALERIDPPSRALDVGTGTGGAARAIAQRFPTAEVVGVDLSGSMLERARELVPADAADRMRFDLADASRLPYDDASFDLVGLSNMIPFFDELDRVLSPGGWLIVAFSGGAGTPIYVPPERLRDELGRRGFTDFAEISTDPGTALVARKGA